MTDISAKAQEATFLVTGRWHTSQRTKDIPTMSTHMTPMTSCVFITDE